MMTSLQSLRRLAWLATGLWSWRLAAALIVAAPWVDLARASGAAAHADGDAALFSSGGLVLLDVLHRAEPGLRAAAWTTAAAFALLSLAGALPLAAVLAALATRSRRGAFAWLAEGTAAFPRQIAITAGAGVGRALLALAAAWAAVTVGASFATPDERHADLGRVAILALGFAGGAGVGVVADCARVVSLRDGLGPVAATRRSLGALRAGAWWVVRAWSWRAGVTAALSVAALVAVARVDVSRPEPWRPAAAWLAGQLCLWAIAALRVSWFARLFELTAPEPPAGGSPQAASPAADW
ncbi:MAG: hypothetical protein IT376_21545 [Polyangiaceae bacterium]|nr:hypothetical protein [Polyangiaceae bacterium]